jgi:uncharacterized protein (TIRG00374 family)
VIDPRTHENRSDDAAPKAPQWSTKAVLKRTTAIVATGVTFYFILPKLTQVFASWPKLSTLKPIWFAGAVGAEITSFICTFALKRIALRTKVWFAVVTAALTGNAVTNTFPGADAAGAAMEFHMLEQSGIDADRAIGGLTAFSLLGIGSLLALPVFALPAIAFGTPVRRGLAQAAYLGAAGFALFAASTAVVLTTDRPLAVVGRFLERARNRVARRSKPVHGLDRRLLEQRNEIRSVLGSKWKQAVILTTGRLGFDFACLLFALRATGSRPQPALVLLAYAAAGVVALIPLTPGGLGIVEASLSGLLILAGVNAADAFLSTLTYRLASYWLPLIAGPFAYLLFRRRFGKGTPRLPSVHDDAPQGTSTVTPKN